MTNSFPGKLRFIFHVAGELKEAKESSKMVFVEPVEHLAVILVQPLIRKV